MVTPLSQPAQRKYLKLEKMVLVAAEPSPTTFTSSLHFFFLFLFLNGPKFHDYVYRPNIPSLSLSVGIG